MSLPSQAHTEPDGVGNENQGDNCNDNNIKLLNIKYNDMTLVIITLVTMMVDHTIELTTKHVKSGKYSDMYIYFDGIPSLAKIKEQAGRRIFPEIMKELTKKIINEVSACIEKDLQKILLPEYPPSIALGSDVINKLREKLADINDIKLGKFNINPIVDGEAEHQIMVDLLDNPQKFKDKRILLASPDADLILLCLIIATKGYSIDIFRENANMNNNLLYSRIYDYLFLDKLKTNLGFYSKQRVIDICYMLLLLGDDFVPIVPGITVKSMPQLLMIYDNLTKDNKNFKIICDNKIDPHNFALYFKELNKNLRLIKPKKYKSNVHDKLDNFNKISRSYFIEEFCGKNKRNINSFKRLYLLGNGFINNGMKYISLVDNMNTTPHKKTENIQIRNYLEGCLFIFDLYINNHIKDYSWVYRYEFAPTLKELSHYLEKNNMDTITYSYNMNRKYLTLESYTKYMTDYKNMIILDLIHHINKNINTDTNNKRTIINEHNLDSMKTLYITYDNVKYLFNCNGKVYFNKCLEIIPPIKLDSYL